MQGTRISLIIISKGKDGKVIVGHKIVAYP